MLLWTNFRLRLRKFWNRGCNSGSVCIPLLRFPISLISPSPALYRFSYSTRTAMLISDEHTGSISAEHGLGFAKNKYLEYSKSKEHIEMMRRIKKVFDPKGLLNPYKYLPPQEHT